MKGHVFRLVSEQIRKAAADFCMRAPFGTVVQFMAALRTNEQNAKMHAMIGDICRAKPEGRVHSPQVWKALLMADAGFKPLFEVALDGQGIVPIGFKSSRLNKAEFSDLIEAIYAYGSKHGVRWSEPEREEA